MSKMTGLMQQGAGKVFGNVNDKATIVDGEGKTVADPRKGLSMGNILARQALAGGLSGLGGAMTNRQQPAPYTPIQVTPQQPLPADLTQAQGPMYWKRGNNPLFGS